MHHLYFVFPLGITVCILTSRPRLALYVKCVSICHFLPLILGSIVPRPGHRWYLLWELSSALWHPCPLPAGCDCTPLADRRCLQTLPNVAPGGEQKDPRLRTLALVYKCPIFYVCFYFKPTIVGVSRFSNHMNSKIFREKISFCFSTISSSFLSFLKNWISLWYCFSFSWKCR